MKSQRVRIAVATVSDKGLEDSISHEFGHSKTFTIIDVEDGGVKSVEIIRNPAAVWWPCGRGLVVTNHLANMGVNMVVSGEIGSGASTMLNELGMGKVIVKPGQRVIDALKEKALVSLMTASSKPNLL